MIEDGDDFINGLLMEFGQTAVDEQPMRHQEDFRSPEAVIERARKYVAKMPVAVSGDNGSGKTFNVACVLVKGFELPTEDALEILREYSDRCDPPWSEHELQHKINDAARAKGSSGYLRNAKTDNWERIPIPEHRLPPQRQQKPERAKPAKNTMAAVVEKAIEHSKQGHKALIDLGIPELNAAIGGGVEFGEMLLIAARPSHGKSAMALQMISAMTAKGIRCAFVSEEMTELMIGKRVLQFAQPMPSHMWAGQSDALIEKMGQYFANREECYIIENCRTVENVCDQIRELAKNDGVKAVVVDYVQLLQSSGSRYETVTQNSVALRQVCTETGVLLIALAQMSRAIEGRDSFVPKTSDLKESGQLEQDADVILFLVWPWKLDANQPKFEYHIYAAKNRNREVVNHVVSCEFDPARQRIRAARPETNYDEFAN